MFFPKSLAYLIEAILYGTYPGITEAKLDGQRRVKILFQYRKLKNHGSTMKTHLLGEQMSLVFSLQIHKLYLIIVLYVIQNKVMIAL